MSEDRWPLPHRDSGNPNDPTSWAYHVPGTGRLFEESPFKDWSPPSGLNVSPWVLIALMPGLFFVALSVVGEGPLCLGWVSVSSIAIAVAVMAWRSARCRA